MTDASRLDAFLAAQRLTNAYELSDLSPQEINRLSVTDYARIRESAGLPGIDPYSDAYAKYEASAPQGQEQPSVPVQEPQSAPQGIDPDSDEFFLAWRQNRARGGEGIGIMNQSGQSWAEAARRQPGRSSWQNANVVEPPRLEGRYVRQDDMRDTRPAAERFSTPGNAFGN
jgi:hypothetical protein